MAVHNLPQTNIEPPLETCKKCGIEVETTKYKIRRRELRNGFYIVRHYTLCRDCYLELITKHCDECLSETLFYDETRDELSCKSCGLVLEQGGISHQS